MIRGLHGSDIARKIVGEAAPADDGPDDQAPEGDGDPRVEAARVTLGALKEDDAESFADALGALVDLHGAAPQAEAKPALKVTLRRGGT